MREIASTVANYKALSSISESLLEESFRIANRADTRPRNIKAKILRLCLIALVGIVGVVSSMYVISAGYPESQPERFLAAFALCGSISVVIASFVGLAIVSWSAYVYQYVKSLYAASEAEEATEEAQQLLSASASLSADPRFEREIVEAIVEHFFSTINDPQVRAQLKHTGLTEMVRDVDEKSLHELSCSAAQFMMRGPQNGLLKKIDHAVIAHFSRYDQDYGVRLEEEKRLNNDAVSFAH